MKTVIKLGQMTDGEISRELSDPATTGRRRAELEAEMADRAEKRAKGEVWYPGTLV